MPKPFEIALEEWKQDNRYSIGEDCGWEFSDIPEPDQKTQERVKFLKELISFSQ